MYIKNYRPEIDGLRSLAIVPVLLFHAGFKFFSGGYIGVDVFFVISGYLITGIILNEINENKYISILNAILPLAEHCRFLLFVQGNLF